jgi:Hint domain-containing protein
MPGPGTIDAWLGASGDWSDPANWSLGVPGAADSASFGGTAPFTVTFATIDTIDQLLDPADPGATLELASGTLSLLDGGTWSGAFLLEAGAQIGLGAGALTLSGGAALDGTIAGPGTVVAGGSADAARLLLTGGAVLRDLGTITADSAITLGTSATDAATLSVAADATFDILDDSSIGASGTASIVNAGLFIKSGVNGTSFVGPSFSNSGTITIGRGTLAFDAGADQLGGTIDGGGELDLRGGGAYTILPGIVLVTGRLAILDSATDVTLGTSTSYAAAFTLGTAAQLDLNGHSFDLTGGSAALLGTIAGAGSIAVTGSADANGLVLAGDAVLVDRGTMTEDGVDLNSFGNPTITNAGLLEKTGVSGASFIFANLTNSGTIAVGRGTLSLRAGVASLGGTITGAGEFDLNSAANYTLQSGLVLNAAAFALLGGADVALDSGQSYGGALSLGTGTTLDLNGNPLTLSGTAALDGRIEGAGTAMIAGSADANGLVVYGAAALEVTGTLSEDGALTLGSGTDTALIHIETSGTYDLIAGIDLVLDGHASVNNAGLFEKTGLGGISHVAVNVANAGTIAAAAGTLAFDGSLINDGLMRVTHGELAVGQSLAADAGRSGTISIGAIGTVLLDSALSAAESVTFTADSAQLALLEPTRIGATIGGLAVGDRIDLIDAAFTPGADSLSLSDGLLTVLDQGATIASLHLAGNYTAADFQLTGDGGGGTDIVTTNVPCFLAGTRIGVPSGEVPVEALRPGDAVLTAGGTVMPVVWIGERRIACRLHKRPHKVLPVRIAAGAFGTGLPRRDLLLSPDHAVFAGGVLIPAKLLANAVTVRQEQMAEAHYFHIELATHEVILAEGLAVESYLDCGNRAEFANIGGGIAPRRDPTSLGPAPRVPLCISGAVLAAVKRGLLERVRQLGYRAVVAPDLHIMVGDRAIGPMMIRDEFYRFMLPDGARDVCVVSRTGIPAECDAASEDGRRLGVAVAAVSVDGEAVGLDEPALGAGFYAPERSETAQWRWTNGRAWLSLPRRPGGSRPRNVELLVQAAAPSWIAPPTAVCRPPRAGLDAAAIPAFLGADARGSAEAARARRETAGTRRGALAPGA